MIREYWARVGGTLIKEFIVTRAGVDRGARMLDAVIILDGEHRVMARGRHHRPRHHLRAGRVYEAHGDWTRPKSGLPLFRNEWLLDGRVLREQRLDGRVLREQRLRVLKPDDE